MTPYNIKSGLNWDGRLKFRDGRPELGWQTETYGSVVHALQPRLKMIWPIGYITDTINAKRKAQWVAEEEAKNLDIDADSDHAGGCDRKSTSGGIIFNGQHCISHGVTTNQL